MICRPSGHHQLSRVSHDGGAPAVAFLDDLHQVPALGGGQAVGPQLSKSLIEGLQGWLRAERDRLSKHNPVVRAIDYMFKV